MGVESDARVTARHVVDTVADLLGVPAALLHRAGGEWRFEAEAIGSGYPSDTPWADARAAATVTTREPEDGRWTGVMLGTAEPAAWILLLPGAAADWDSTYFMSDVAPRLGALLDGVSLRDELIQSRRFAKTYHRFGRRLLRVQSARALHELILRTMARQVRARVGALALYLPDEARLAVVATHGYPIEVIEHVRIRPGDGVLGTVFASGRATLVERTDASARRLRYRTNAYLALPIKGASSVLAVVAFTDRDDGEPFTRADLDALRVLANPAGLALSADTLRQTAAEVSHLASTDPLTGLLNRRYFDERLYAELQRARRHGDQLALLMVDLDRFKAINDAYGHQRGDQVLRCVADRLRRSVRIFDVCTRYGGDEFAVLMPSSMTETAVAVAERIRDTVRRHCSSDGLPVTVSVGVAFSGGVESDVLALADRALIEAKRGGKDTVRVHG